MSDKSECVECPFCGEDDFDLMGLKGHMVNDCDKFRGTQVTPRVF